MTRERERGGREREKEGNGNGEEKRLARVNGNEAWFQMKWEKFRDYFWFEKWECQMSGRKTRNRKEKKIEKKNRKKKKGREKEKENLVSISCSESIYMLPQRKGTAKEKGRKRKK